MFGKAFKKFRAWLSRWQEPIVWLPLLLALLLGAYYVIPAIDPRSGVDGFGSLWGMLITAIGAVFAAFFAWLFVEAYHLSLRDSDERELLDHACGIERSLEGKRLGAGPQSWTAVVIYIWNQALWLAVFWLLLQRFVG